MIILNLKYCFFYLEEYADKSICIKDNPINRIIAGSLKASLVWNMSNLGLLKVLTVLPLPDFKVQLVTSFIIFDTDHWKLRLLLSQVDFSSPTSELRNEVWTSISLQTIKPNHFSNVLDIHHLNYYFKNSLIFSALNLFHKAKILLKIIFYFTFLLRLSK